MAEARLLEGKKISEKIQAWLAEELVSFSKHTEKIPKMVAIRINEDQASELYLKTQRRAAEAVGVIHETISILGADEQKLLAEIYKANQDPSVHGAHGPCICESCFRESHPLP